MDTSAFPKQACCHLTPKQITNTKLDLLLSSSGWMAPHLDSGGSVYLTLFPLQALGLTSTLLTPLRLSHLS